MKIRVSHPALSLFFAITVVCHSSGVELPVMRTNVEQCLERCWEVKELRVVFACAAAGCRRCEDGVAGAEEETGLRSARRRNERKREKKDTDKKKRREKKERNRNVKRKKRENRESERRKRRNEKKKKGKRTKKKREQRKVVL